MSREELKTWSKEKTKNNFGNILVVVIIMTIYSLLVYYLGEETNSIVSIIAEMIGFILEIGSVVYLVNLINNREFKLDMLWSKFNDWKKIFTVYLLRLINVFLWLLLLVIPGLIKSISYALVPYILADDTEKSSKEILKYSEEIMQGHKMEYFTLLLSFIGWHILAVFTLGILEIWILPYQKVTITKYLYDLKTNYESTNKTKTIPVTENQVNNSNNQATSTNFCPNCGAKLAEATIFCQECGKQIK